MKKVSLFALFGLTCMGLLACNSTSSSSSSESSSSSTPTSSSAESVDYLAALSSEKALYSIRLDYRIASGDGTTLYANGYSRKQVFSGTDDDGADVKIKSFLGSDTYLSNLDDNPTSTTTTYAVYHTPTRTYTLSANGTYAITSETHPDENFEPMDLSFDYSHVSSYVTEADGYSTIVTLSFGNDSDASSFLGEELGSSEAASGITGLSFSATLSSSLALTEAEATYTKNGYKYTASWTYSSTMSTITLPS
ncbi:MAG: hypothetical protein Q4F15_05645 [Bacillota bacterium]|nr:hypothetical protein [Bacillota bacterium]